MAMAVAMIIVILVISRGVRRREGENADRTRNGAYEIVFHDRLLPTFCHAGRTFARLLVSRELGREIVSGFPSAVWERRVTPRVYRLGECPRRQTSWTTQRC